jgi:hypothetical protein
LIETISTAGRLPDPALVPIRSDLDRARHVAAVRCHRSLDLRHVTERRFVHLKEIRGTQAIVCINRHD